MFVFPKAKSADSARRCAAAWGAFTSALLPLGCSMMGPPARPSEPPAGASYVQRGDASAASSAAGVSAAPLLGFAVKTPAGARVRERLEAIRARLSSLAGEVIAFWISKGPDAAHGGFYGTLDRLGNKTSPTEKGLIQQSRHLFTFSNWYAMKEQSPRIRSIADDVYHFLVKHFYDRESKQFYYKVSESGRTVDARKILYAESFAIFGLSTYGRVFQVPGATALALETFRALEARHDAVHGGYDEHNDAGYLPQGATKSTNAHIHLMEAFTALLEATAAPLVRTRLEELVGIIAGKVVQPKGQYAAPLFRDDWTLFGEPIVSYGHDLETVWLLGDAARALGRPSDSTILAAMLTIGQHAAVRGYDPRQGGYFEEGIPQGEPTMTDKIWWVQSEALAGLFWLYRLTADTGYLDKLEGTLGFIETRLRDNANPGTEWFWGLTRDGAVNAKGDAKGEEWKASYHNSRALTFTERWIARCLAGSL